MIVLETVEANAHLREIMQNLSEDLSDTESRHEVGDDLLDMMDNL